MNRLLRSLRRAKSAAALRAGHVPVEFISVLALNGVLHTVLCSQLSAPTSWPHAAGGLLHESYVKALNRVLGLS